MTQQGQICQAGSVLCLFALFSSIRISVSPLILGRKLFIFLRMIVSFYKDEKGKM